MKRILISLFIFCFSLVAAHADDERLTQNHFSVNYPNGDVSGLLALVAAETGLNFKSDKELGILVTMNKTNVTGKEILDQLVQDQQIEYSVVGSDLIVTKRNTGVPGVVGGNVHRFPLRYSDGKEILSKLIPLIPPSDKLIVDEHANAIILVGSEDSWKRVSDVLNYLDIAQTQILIEAQILETSDQFLRDIGVSFNSQKGNNNTSTSNPIADASNLTYTGIFGQTLNLQLQAAETKGTAKVLSRPKVLTLNNQKAKIESGVTINVKTLSTAISNPTVAAGSTSTGIQGLAATSGVTTINAGLSLEILPSIVGNDMIKLSVNINNSQPDSTDAVDGIPAVQNNAAETSIIVKTGETAIIAGLVKQSKSHTSSGVPFFSSIPLIGLLFGSDARTETNDELVIFITPTIDNGHLKVLTAQAKPPGQT
jgi:type II secretory pathway component GspD/PulD (secretin)